MTIAQRMSTTPTGMTRSAERRDVVLQEVWAPVCSAGLAPADGAWPAAAIATRAMKAIRPPIARTERHELAAPAWAQVS